MTQNIFKYAAKKALRFPYYKGMIAVEDLFNISMTDLDFIYKSLKKQQKTSNEESLINDKTPEDKALEVKLAIVKEIFEDKTIAADKAKKAAENKAKNQKILEILAKKENEALENMTEEELKAQLALDEDVEDEDE